MRSTDSELGALPGSLFPKEVQLRRIQKVMEHELTEKQRRVIVDHYYNGMRVTDIAQSYGISKSTVSRTLQRAIRRLRRSLVY